MSIIFRYSSDNVVWHEFFRSGDMYFQTSEDEGVTWSASLQWASPGTIAGKQDAYAILTTLGELAYSPGWLYNDGDGALSYSTPNKSDVGLGLVENTALSTWAGSTNLTTLGALIRLGVGTSDFSTPDGLIHFSQGDGSALLIINDTVGNGSTFLGRRADGTTASKTSLVTDDYIIGLSGKGWMGAGYSSGNPGVRVRAAENWNGTAQGTYVSFAITPLGSTSSTERLFLAPNRSLLVGFDSIASDPLPLVDGHLAVSSHIYTGNNIYAKAFVALPVQTNGGANFTLSSSSSDPRQTYMISNWYYGGTPALDRYATAGGVPMILFSIDASPGEGLDAGDLAFYTAPSGLADSAVTWALQMQLRSGGGIDLNDSVRITPTAAKLGVGTSIAQSTLDLGMASLGRQISWGGASGGDAWFSSLGSAYSSAALSILSGLKCSVAADQYLASVTGTIGQSGIRCNPSDGIISLFSRGGTAVTSGDIFDWVANTKLTVKPAGVSATALGIGMDVNAGYPASVFAGSSAGVNPALWLSGGAASAQSGVGIIFHNYFGTNPYPTWRLGEVCAVYDNAVNTYDGSLVFRANKGTSVTDVVEVMRLLGAGWIFLPDRSSAPTSNPSGGGYIYTESGALKYRGSSGTVTNLANA